jgi:hypothetical protein
LHAECWVGFGSMEQGLTMAADCRDLLTAQF